MKRNQLVLLLLLLAQLCLASVAGAQTNGVLREVWLNIGGGTVPDLTNSVAFPGSPDFDEVITNGFEAPTNVYESYGQRLRALLVPPTTGNYVFLIASDDASHLYLSTNDTPAAKRLIARVDGWTPARYFHLSADQKSADVWLVAGRRYYLEVLMKEGNGGDNLAVTWQKPGEAEPADGSAPIPNANLVPYGLGLPVFTVHPRNASVVESGFTNFTVQLERLSGNALQWVCNGTNLPGATTATLALGPLRMADSGSSFYCRASNAHGTTNSNPAILTVTADAVRPTISYVQNYGEDALLTVGFSEPVEAVSAGNAGNYQINNGVAVLSATLLTDGVKVLLKTSPLARGVIYTLTVNDVRDRAQTPNVILPNSQRLFALSFAPLPIGCVIGTNEPAGPSSRRTPLAISEIMYHPAARADGRNTEFIEIYNSNPWPEDLGGHRISGDAGYTFPAGTTIPALDYRIVAANPADFQAVYGLTNVLGPLTNGTPGNVTNVLANGGSTLRLRDELNAVLLEVNYSDAPPWPAAADGAGHSLVLARPSYGEGDVRAWAASDRVGGSPGAYDVFLTSPARAVFINEILAHTDPPQEDFVELFNYSSAAVDLSGCVLTDDPTTNRFRLEAGTTIPARGFLALTGTQLGFRLNAAGETVYFIASDGSRVLDALRFDAQENGVAFGRYPDGALAWHRLTSVTLGTNNARPVLSEVVINEVQYHPASEDDDEEFVELYNRGTNAVALGKWRLSGGISYTFPTNTIMPADSYLVVAGNISKLLAAHPNLSAAAVLGGFSGKLANGGDVVRLNKPDDLVSTNELGQLVTNKIHIVVDEVNYGTGGRWGRWADGGGSSLERIDPRGDGNLAPTWADSDETAKSGWTTVEFTGLLDNGGMVAADQLQLFLLGAGECLVDNVEVIPQGGANVVANGNFDADASGWFFQGTHEQSAWQASSGVSGGCLRIVASSRGDAGANRIRTVLTQTLAEGTTATLRAKVRWLAGHPEILLRLHGNWLEAAGDTLTTRDCGSPGAQNTQFRANTGPAITGVRHWPTLPVAGQAATVTAQIEDPDGLAQVVLKYRVDPASNYVTVAMSYSGAGLFSAAIPGQDAGVRAAFYIEARDGFTPSAVARFPSDAPGRECLVGFGENTPAGSFGAYRLWVSQRNVTRWASREKQSNQPIDATFAYGTGRVCYNVDTLYSGSPWHTPGYNSPDGNTCDYEVNFPKDDLVLGTDDFVLATIGNLNSDPSFQAEQTAFWIGRKLGAPYMHRRYIRLFFNGQQRSEVYEDVQQPNAEVVSEFFPDDDNGSLHKIEDWFEFNDTGDNMLGNVDATLQNFTTTGGAKKTARYRWTWRPRATREAANAFTNLFALVDALNSTQPEPYRSRVAALVNVEEFMRILAMERIVGNWDSYGYARGKNLFIYKPTAAPWVFLPWDVDFVFSSGGTGTSDPLFGSNEPIMDAFRAFPEFQRAYWRAFQDAVNGPLQPTTLSARLDPRYNALIAAGVGANSPQDLKNYAAQRRTFIQSQLATVVASFAVKGASSFTTNRNLITLTGTAPIGIATLTVNGVLAVPTWTTVTNWTLRVALQPGVNNLAIQGWNNQGQAVAGATASRTITYNGAVEAAQDRIVFNEIMYNPLVPDTSFVELHSTATNNAFDLSNWRLNGLDGTIPPGTILEPGGFLVFVKDREEFARFYGAAIPIAGVFDGSFDKGGETLKLLRPGASPDLDEVIDKVTYDDDPPWPAAADGTGPSLQLIDPTQDNNRVANWAVALTNQAPPPPQTLLTWSNNWKYMQTANLDGVAWTAPAFADTIWPAGRGVLAAEDCNCLPEPIRTPLTAINGRITFYFRTSFNYTGSLAGVALKLTTLLDDGAVFYLNGTPIYELRMGTYTPSYSSVASPYVGDANYEGPFTVSAASLRAGTNVLAVEVHQNSATSTDIVLALKLETDFSAGTTNRALYTPGMANSVRAAHPVFPKLWLNEVLPANVAGLTNGIADRFGERDPWVEIYNGGTNAVSLSGFFLSTNYANPLLWPFPTNATINPGQFRIVWLDGEPAESSSNEWHTSFRLPAGIGALLLASTVNGQTEILDYFNYSVGSVGRAYGDFPDANVSGRQLFTIPTPGATNNPAGLPLPVFINEWMAENSVTLADPADSQFEDWFELFNADDSPADLSGYYLTDTLTNKTKWQIPSGTIIAPHSYLLVWADDEIAQNAAGRDLHANFKLDKAGEALGLFSPSGIALDAITFGAQTNDVSQGRFADGAAGIYYQTTPTPRAANVVAQTNLTPTLDALPNRTIGEGSLLTFTTAATDANTPKQRLSFSLDPGAPAGASIGANDGVFNWLPTEADGPGSYPITVRVTDNGSSPLSTAQTFSVQVNEVNDAPLLAPLAPRTIAEGETLTLTNSATDQDTPAQGLTFTLDSGAPAGMTIGATSGIITWTPTEAQGPGNYPITVRVTDDGEPPASTTQPLAVTVVEVNEPPQFAPLAYTSLVAGQTLILTNLAQDNDLPPQTLAFSLLDAPAGVGLDPVTGRLNWRPTMAQSPSTNLLVVAVADNGTPSLSATQSFRVNVLRPIQPTLSISSPFTAPFTMTVTGDPGPDYTILASTDLLFWQTEFATNSPALPFTWTDATAPAIPQRFYRVLLQP
jgi:hypothetical protein